MCIIVKPSTTFDSNSIIFTSKMRTKGIRKRRNAIVPLDKVSASNNIGNCVACFVRQGQASQARRAHGVSTADEEFSRWGVTASLGSSAWMKQ